MELIYTEWQTKGVGLACRIRETLHRETTPYQDLAVIDTVEFGRMLVLDGTVQTTIADEFVYHEMITHVPLMTHPNPKRVAVIGGGDGGAIREILKHPSVEEAHLIEIDEAVVRVSKEYLPEISCALDDPRVKVMLIDGIKHIQETKDYYDVVIVDSTDPVGPAVGLFSQEFYKAVYQSLKEDGVLVAQSESPFFNQNVIQMAYPAIRKTFPIARLYVAAIPTYPSGFWTFSLGSKTHDPLKANLDRASKLETRYYTPELQTAAFALPKFVKDLVEA